MMTILLSLVSNGRIDEVPSAQLWPAYRPVYCQCQIEAKCTSDEGKVYGMYVMKFTVIQIMVVWNNMLI